MSDDIDSKAIKDSFSRVSTFGNNVGVYFYHSLFLTNPELHPLFSSQRMGEQPGRLLKALARIVGNIDKVEELRPFLETLGRTHRSKYRVHPGYFPLVAEALIATLSHYDSEWTPQLQDEWVKAYTVIAGIMTSSETAFGEALPGEMEVALGRAPDSATITAQSVRSTRFSKVRRWRRGYKSREVDAFMSLVAGELAQDEEDIRGLRAELTRIKREYDEHRRQWRAINSDLR